MVVPGLELGPLGAEACWTEQLLSDLQVSQNFGSLRAPWLMPPVRVPGQCSIAPMLTAMRRDFSAHSRERSLRTVNGCGSRAGERRRFMCISFT
jgi:hypothetical protein